jgi:3-dehydroquinate dehydratase/shikimate dehydrogenase
MSRVCHVITGPAAAAPGSLVELRLDRDPGLRAPEGCDAIVTYRARREGGAREIAEADRRAALERAAAGAWAVDVEASSPWRPEGVRLILSLHDFEKTPDDLEARVAAMEGERTAFVKVATLARGAADLGRLAALQRKLGARGVVIPMGPVGAPARVLFARHGMPWTYASDAEDTAQGQFPAGLLRDRYRFEKIGPATRAFCVAGNPVSHSRSPEVFNAYFRDAGLDAVYVAAPAAAGELFATLDALGVEGASVTVPLKAEAFAGCAVEGAAPGAVNTLTRAGSAWRGRNTDVPGFRRALEHGLGRPAKGLRVVVLGAGGVASAVAAALAPDNEVTIVARRPEQAAALAARVGGVAAEGGFPREWDLLVNATPVGMAGSRELPLDPSALHAGRAVFDCVYTPRETALLREAKARGCRAIDGAGMFVEQAALQAEGWFGVGTAPKFRAVAERMTAAPR